VTISGNVYGAWETNSAAISSRGIMGRSPTPHDGHGAPEPQWQASLRALKPRHG